MAAGKSGQASRIFVWIILVLLIVGLAGFGATNFGGSNRSLGSVGDAEIPIDRFVRSFDQEMSSLSAQVGRRLTVEEAQSLGMDRRVLDQLVTNAAAEHETKRIGLSVGDAQIGRQLTQTPQFQGASGQFDQNTYEFVLRQSGTSPAEYEETVRTEMAVTLLQAAVSTGIKMPSDYSRLVAEYLGETRSFSWIALEARDLPTPIGTPDEATLRAFYDEDPTRFLLPEKRDITYAWLSPDDVIDTLEISEAEVRAIYEERSAEFNQPERRLVERLVFADLASAQSAADQIASGAAQFEDVVTARGLAIEDIDLGDLSQDDLGAAGPAVFAAAEPGVVGPVETDLGPGLFRINAILAARSTPFEDVAEDLRAEFAGDRARRVIADQLTDFDDLLAGGATIEDLANETDMTLGQIDWIADENVGIGAYQAFAEAAARTSTDDFPEIIELEDGGLVALRVNTITPEQPEAFETAKIRVEAAWVAQQTDQALAALAEDLAAQANDGARLSALGYITDVQNKAKRLDRIGGAPDELMQRIYELEVGEALFIGGAAMAFVAQLDEIQPVDMTDQETVTLMTGVNDAVNQSVAVDLLEAYTRDVRAEAGISINQTALDQILNQLQTTR